jgi:hypothetical protein
MSGKPINLWINGFTFSTTAAYLRLILRLPSEDT